MTLETKNRLEQELSSLQKNYDRYSHAQGEACGINCDWHDNAAYEFAQRQTEFYAAELMQVKRLLHNAKITKPRTETDKVGLGNKVVLKLNGKEMTVTLLTEEDSITRKEWLSCNSPIGKNILGKPVGKHGDTEIVAILAGDFA